MQQWPSRSAYVFQANFGSEAPQVAQCLWNTDLVAQSPGGISIDDRAARKQKTQATSNFRPCKDSSPASMSTQTVDFKEGDLQTAGGSHESLVWPTLIWYPSCDDLTVPRTKHCSCAQWRTARAACPASHVPQGDQAWSEILGRINA